MTVASAVMQVTQAEKLVQVAQEEWQSWHSKVLFSKYFGLQGQVEPVRTLFPAVSQVVQVVLAVTQVLQL